ncbi:MAG: radical SAM protein [Candidatus Omnitrophica bacterium]|nr:radical SAM protein [Candidatus Omnitrophota bacterium]
MSDSIFWDQVPPDESSRADNTSLDYYPTKAIISLTSRCNLCCWHCRHRLNPEAGIDAPKKLLDYVIENILPFCKSLRIGGANVGKPLLAENFNYFLKSLNFPTLKEILLITNLTLLDEEKANLICQKIDFITVSLEGTEDNYTYTRGYPWQGFLEKLKLLSRARRNYPKKNQICLTVCTFLKNLDNLPKLLDLERGLADKIVLRDFHAWEDDKKKDLLVNDKERVLAFIERFEKKAKDVGMPVEIQFKNRFISHDEKTKRKGKIKNCYFPWTCISIGESGQMSPCCSIEELARLVNYNENFLDIWNSEPFKKLRRTVNSENPMHSCLVCDIKTGELSIEDFNRLVSKKTGLFRKIIKNKFLRQNLRFLRKILPEKLLNRL